MGFSVSASTAIVVAGLFLAFGMFYPAMANSFERVTGAESDSADDLLDQRNTAIELQNATTENVTDEEGWTLTVNVTNNGSTAITVSTVDLLVDNGYQNRSEMNTTVYGQTADDTTDLWLPGETLELAVDGLTDQPARTTVVVRHGIRVSGSVTDVTEGT
ncbi:MAG: flagellin [Halobacteriota archaeon]